MRQMKTNMVFRDHWARHQCHDGDVQLDSHTSKNKSLKKKQQTACLKELEKEEPTELKAHRRKETLKTRMERNKTENGRMGKKVSETQSWFFKLFLMILFLRNL